jgi:hypothetical protein
MLQFCSRLLLWLPVGETPPHSINFLRAHRDWVETKAGNSVSQGMVEMARTALVGQTAPFPETRLPQRRSSIPLP